MRHHLVDLLDIPRLQSALDSLHVSSGIPSAILDTEGGILTASGWQDVCTKFHRVHPETRKRCTEIDFYINRHIHEAPPTISYKCPYGLIDSATPIIIEGEHLGNVFAGQVFREEPDLEYFRAQARAHGFDEGAYIDAVKKVPIISEKASQENLAFIAHLTGMLAEVGLNHLREKEAERQRRETEERYRSLFDNASDGIFILSLDGKLIDVNESFARMHGYGTGELLQMNIRDLDTTETARLIPERMRQLLAGEILSFEVEHLHKDGHAFPLEVSANLISIGGESFIQCFHRDITDRKRAEEELRESEARFRQMVESSPVPIGIAAKDGTIEYLNPRFVATFGYEREDIPGLNDWFQQAFPAPDYRRDVFLRWRKMMEDPGGRVSDEGIELEVTCKDGSVRVVELLPSAAGEKNLAIFRDITVQKRTEEEKRNLERQVHQEQKLESLGVLAGGIAHDFNNLLMVVLGHAELALKEISPMSPARGSLAEITTATHRAADLCRQMLAYAGKASFTLERVGLRELVGEMAHLLKAAISKKAILNLNLERGLPPIEADPSQIRQIVMNLIINATEAIGDRSGVITVSVGGTRCDEEYLRRTQLREDLAPGLYVHLEVADTGHGMDAETRSRIFEPFFSTKFTGRGLGLAAVLGIVRSHKGALKVYSEPGKGTTFKVLFPALEEAEEGAPAVDSSPSTAWRGKRTILLVDDEESLLDLGARMLEHLGFSVLTAADGVQALDLYRERGKEIDFVLMDLTMPHMDGAEAFGELRRLNPDVRVVVTSGYSPEDVASRFAGKGIAGVLQKPYTLAKLKESLSGLMPKRP